MCKLSAFVCNLASQAGRQLYAYIATVMMVAGNFKMGEQYIDGMG